nr:MAG TPA: hypothetical protein [Caudoviricetes sp.]
MSQKWYIKILQIITKSYRLALNHNKNLWL